MGINVNEIIKLVNIVGQVQTGAAQGVQGQNQQGGGQSIFQKLGINSTDDLKAGFELFREDPSGTSKVVAETLGGCPELAAKLGGKIGGLINKFLA